MLQYYQLLYVDEHQLVAFLQLLCEHPTLQQQIFQQPYNQHFEIYKKFIISQQCQ